jgi:membrane associated rhomboid family serine protease
MAVRACPSCHGIWFDADVFLPAAKALADRTKASADLGFLFKPRQVDSPDSCSRRLCPRCTTLLRNFNYAYDSNIMLDKCPSCGGVWTDPGEIQQVAAYLKGDPRVQEIGRDLLKRQKYLERIAAAPQPLSPIMYYLPHALPLGNDLERRRMPAATAAIIIFCVIVFALTARDIDMAVLWGHTPADFSVVRLFAHMFLHADVFHLLGNMWFLWLFGRSVEDRLNCKRFIALYVAAGLAASIVQTLANVSSPIPMVGASGAVSGIMGMYLVFFPHAGIKLFCWGHVVHVTAGFYLGFWFVLQLLNGLFCGAGSLSDVAWFAHIGGFCFGAAAAFIMKDNRPKAPV